MTKDRVNDVIQDVIHDGLSDPLGGLTDEANFPDGSLLIREFSTLSEAHTNANRLAKIAAASVVVPTAPVFRLVEISPTAAGVWVCAWVASTLGGKNLLRSLGEHGFEVVEIDATTMKAFLSLGPKPPADAVAVGIVEDASIAEVFRAAHRHSRRGLTLLEIRVKRAGAAGAYAFFALNEAETSGESSAEISAASSVGRAMTVLPLVGDYRRFF